MLQSMLPDASGPGSYFDRENNCDLENYLYSKKLIFLLEEIQLQFTMSPHYSIFCDQDAMECTNLRRDFKIFQSF